MGHFHRCKQNRAKLGNLNKRGQNAKNSIEDKNNITVLVPAWSQLVKLKDDAVLALAKQLNIDSSLGRMQTLSAINKAR